MSNKASNKTVQVKFLKNYSATRGPGITGAKDSVRSFRMTDALIALIDNETVELVRETKAEKRETATDKKKTKKKTNKNK